MHGEQTALINSVFTIITNGIIIEKSIIEKGFSKTVKYLITNVLKLDGNQTYPPLISLLRFSRKLPKEKDGKKKFLCFSLKKDLSCSIKKITHLHRT